MKKRVWAWLEENVVPNHQMRRYFLIGTYFGGLAAILKWGWLMTIPVFLLQILYIIWVVVDKGYVDMIKGQIELAKSLKKKVSIEEDPSYPFRKEMDAGGFKDGNTSSNKR